MSFITNFYNWPVQDLGAVASSQEVLADSPVILDGSYAVATAVAGVTPIGSIDFPGISRAVVITLIVSGSATFVINGLRNNQAIQEIAVMSSMTSYTTNNFFDTVTSITSPTGTDGLTVQVGTGLAGCTRPFVPNTFITTSPVMTAIDTRVITGNATYDVIGSIEKYVGTSMFSGDIVDPKPVYLNQNLVNSVSGQYLTSAPATNSSFITADNLPLTMVSVNIKTSSYNCSLNVRIATPRLSS